MALPNGHPLAAGKAVDIEQLRSEELLLLKEGHCLREHALAACRLERSGRLLPALEDSGRLLPGMEYSGRLLPDMARGRRPL